MSTKVRNGQNVFGNACGTPATRGNCFLALAGFPQREKSAFWALRDFRNEEKVLFGACGIPATREKCFLALAGFPQRGKTAFWCLRDSRKHFQKHFGCPSTLTKTWCGRKEPHSYVELTSINTHHVTREILECLPGSRKRQPVFRGTCGDGKGIQRSRSVHYSLRTTPA